LNPWVRILLCVTAGLTVAVLVKLWSNGLARIYKLLFCFLLSDLISSVAGLSVRYDTNWYGYLYVFLQTLKIAVAVPVLVEIYGLALEKTPALSQFGRNAVRYVLVAAALFPVGMVLVDHASSPNPYLRAFLLFEQTVDATIAIFLIIISAFMAWFPVRMRRNVILYAGGFIVWSLSHSAGVHVVNQWSGNKTVSLAVNFVDMLIIMGCLLVWLLGLKREGESRTAVIGHLWNRAEADRLAEQLDAINNSLEELRRK
jgi:hypothetical protein